jgi:hypothetical protein
MPNASNSSTNASRSKLTSTSCGAVEFNTDEVVTQSERESLASASQACATRNACSNSDVGRGACRTSGAIHNKVQLAVSTLTSHQRGAFGEHICNCYTDDGVICDL